MTEDKTKVKDLATELGVPTKNLLQALRELDIPAKSTSSNIAAEDIDRVKNHLKDSATSEQGDRREVQPGVIVRRRRQSTEDVAAEGEEAPRTERRAPRENHTPTARI
ncbi:MAG: translation initiation factor IF-2 N-terminal domain-containing protein, partial [Bilophila wadsworthia]